MAAAALREPEKLAVWKLLANLTSESRLRLA